MMHRRRGFGVAEELSDSIPFQERPAARNPKGRGATEHTEDPFGPFRKTVDSTQAGGLSKRPAQWPLPQN